jgi:putative pyruvate formate lyase activating enzyme
LKQTYSPSYLALLETGELERRAAAAAERLAHCDLCPWTCRSDRLTGRGSVCRTGALAGVSAYGPHPGEEAPLSGWRGSGTIFFSGCNLRCQYCQNDDISQGESGRLVSAGELAAMMLELQSAGCHNINLVTPSHVLPHILAALVIAGRDGLRLPLVYNTGGYDAVAALQLLEGVVDIYMPDMKYASEPAAKRYSKAPRYPAVNRAAVREMHRQVGDLQIDATGLAQRGLLVRHLVLPHGLAGTEAVAGFLAQEISPHTYFNVMDQYRPEFNVRRYPNQFPKLNRPLKPGEYQKAVEQAHAAGLHRLDH